LKFGLTQPSVRIQIEADKLLVVAATDTLLDAQVQYFFRVRFGGKRGGRTQDHGKTGSNGK